MSVKDDLKERINNNLEAALTALKQAETDIKLLQLTEHKIWSCKWIINNIKFDINKCKTLINNNKIKA